MGRAGTECAVPPFLGHLRPLDDGRSRARRAPMIRGTVPPMSVRLPPAAAPGLDLPSRRALLGLSLAGLLSACSSLGGPSHVEEIDDVGYVPADPQKGVRLINAYRAQNGIAALTFDPDLQRIAGEYARHLAEAGRMTHELEPYGGIEKRLKAGGYAYATAGENLGQGYRTLEQVIAGWKKSPPHDRGMKDTDMTRMGIASAANPRKSGDIYWCLIVAKPRPAGALAGTGPFTPRPDNGVHVWGGAPIPFGIGR